MLYKGLFIMKAFKIVLDFDLGIDFKIQIFAWWNFKTIEFTCITTVSYRSIEGSGSISTNKFILNGSPYFTDLTSFSSNLYHPFLLITFCCKSLVKHFMLATEFRSFLFAMRNCINFGITLFSTYRLKNSKASLYFLVLNSNFSRSRTRKVEFSCGLWKKPI